MTIASAPLRSWSRPATAPPTVVPWATATRSTSSSRSRRPVPRRRPQSAPGQRRSRRVSGVKDLRGRNALVTGAAGGLGGYISHALAAEGVNLVLSDLPEASLDARAGELKAKGVDVETVSADLTDRAEAEGLV